MSLHRNDAGYALVAAVASIVAFAYVSYEILAASRGAMLGVSAQYDHARLAAAADAGLSLAIQGIAIKDRTRRWAIDGSPRTVIFDSMTITISVEDERGKIPINIIDESQVRDMFALAGASGDRLNTLTDSFLDWRDDDDQKRTNGAEAPDYASVGKLPTNGSFRTIDEMVEIKGMDAALLAKLSPAVTVFFGSSGGFDERTANPLALAVMTGGGLNSVASIQRRREQSGQRTALDISEDEKIAGRDLNIRVRVEDGHGARLERATIVEFTGYAGDPYRVRFLE